LLCEVTYEIYFNRQKLTIFKLIVLIDC